jgi:hypothetical protein
MTSKIIVALGYLFLALVPVAIYYDAGKPSMSSLLTGFKWFVIAILFCLGSATVAMLLFRIGLFAWTGSFEHSR